MTKKQKNFSDEDLKKLANRFKILSEPSRLKILRSLFGTELCVTQIIEVTGMLQANVSKQLRILQDNNIVECRPVGVQRFYKVVDETVMSICNQLCHTSADHT